MARPSYLAIVNPAAGGGRCGARYPSAIDRLRAGGLDVEAVCTTRPGHAVDLARSAYADGRRHFIAVGGDGTSYEIVNGLFPAAGTNSNDPPTLGFLPLGTGNSFLRDFTTRGAEHSLPSIAEARIQPCDVLRLRHRDGLLHYINLLSIGFVADVNGRRARQFSRWGETGYVFAVVREVAGLKTRPFPLSVEAGPWDREPMVFASFNNSRFTGGKMMMAPEADTADGLIDYIRVAPLSRFQLLRTFPKIFKGTHVLNPAVTSRKVRNVRFEVDDRIDVMVDGEALEVVPVELDVLEGALRVHV